MGMILKPVTESVWTMLDGFWGMDVWCSDVMSKNSHGHYDVSEGKQTGKAGRVCCSEFA